MEPEITDLQVERIGVTDAIRRAMLERPRTSSELITRVRRLLPSADRKTISTIIGQRVTAGEFIRDGRFVRRAG
jgi:hypothetical protein